MENASYDFIHSLRSIRKLVNKNRSLVGFLILLNSWIKIVRAHFPWGNLYFFGIGHPCYDQLTPVKTRYPLTSISWPYRGLKLTAHRGQVFLEGDRCPGARFSIGSRAHVWLTCWKQGRIVREASECSPRINVNQIITFSSMQMFLLLFCVYAWWLLKLKTEGQTIYRKPQRKVTKLKSKFYFFLG